MVAWRWSLEISPLGVKNILLVQHSERNLLVATQSPPN